MSKYQWLIEKFKELNQNLFFETFEADDIIYKQLLNNNPELLFGKIKELYSLDLFDYTYKINHRITHSGYNQNWHIDGRRVFELRPGVVCPTNQSILNSDTGINNKSKYQIHNIYNPVPIYSILYYSSTWGKDFNGGSIEFINGMVIKPMKNQCIIFDSNLGHHVNLQTSGERKCSLVMLFN